MTQPEGNRHDVEPARDAAFKISVVNAVRTMIGTYPESSLRDVYKSFFQDEYGPGHILGDPTSARSYFERELERMESRGRRAADPCGLGRNFYRAPMDIVLDGVVEIEAYFSAFVESGAGFTIPDVAIWAERWDAIARAIRPMRALIKSFARDSAEISQTLARGEYAMHHSAEYVRNYDPHYRIISVRFALCGEV